MEDAYEFGTGCSVSVAVLLENLCKSNSIFKGFDIGTI
jgi:hypothetical protein